MAQFAAYISHGLCNPRLIFPRINDPILFICGANSLQPYQLRSGACQTPQLVETSLAVHCWSTAGVLLQASGLIQLDLEYVVGRHWVCNSQLIQKRKINSTTWNQKPREHMHNNSTPAVFKDSGSKPRDVTWLFSGHLLFRAVMFWDPCWSTQARVCSGELSLSITAVLFLLLYTTQSGGVCPTSGNSMKRRVQKVMV